MSASPDPEQKARTGVLLGIGRGVLVMAALAALLAGLPAGAGRALAVFEPGALWARCVLAPLLCLTLSVARLAHHRHCVAADRDAAAATVPPGARVLLLQAQLQNTLEQSVMAVMAYAAGCWLLPASERLLLWWAAACFVLGRVLFAHGYARGASGRASGFALTFYPTVLVAVLAAMAAWSTGGSGHV